MKDLTRLREATNEILLNAIKEGSKIGGPVNWGHLSCMDAQKVVQKNREEFYRVIIEEAAPNAVELHDYVVSELFRQGFGEVEVTTEW